MDKGIQTLENIWFKLVMGRSEKFDELVWKVDLFKHTFQKWKSVLRMREIKVNNLTEFLTKGKYSLKKKNRQITNDILTVLSDLYFISY